MIRAIIIEDEKPASDYLLALLQKSAPDLVVLAVIDNVKTAVAWLGNNTADLVFLDIHLGDDNSFSIFEKIKVTIPIIFTTAYNQYAIKAFRLHSIDYLLKPFSAEDLKQAMDKFRELKPKNEGINIQALIEAMNNKPAARERFMVASGQRIKSIPIGEVAYFLSEGRYVKLVAKTGEGYLLDQSLESVESEVDPNHFFRINRQVLVGFDAIRQMVAWSKSRVKLELNPPTDFDVVVSIDNSGDFKKWLNK
ncbi:LytTR family DNA-binding domain-containing protein [Flavobacterium sp. DGU11]|uniref:LytTR family DNA-binding domain-containing protein n=1 Tax=Flavobacterium arundinis TaxID=3139143 RepID=A0ABU9HTD7_9FLAO